MDPKLEGNMDYELVRNMDLALKSSGSRKRNFCRAAKEHMAWKKAVEWLDFLFLCPLRHLRKEARLSH